MTTGGTGPASNGHPVIEADMLEAARSVHPLRSPTVLAMLLAICALLSVGATLDAIRGAEIAVAPDVTVSAALCVAVALLFAGALALHVSKENRWDALVTVGLGCVVLAVGEMERVVSSIEPSNDATPVALDIESILDLCRWAGMAMIVGALAWRAPTRWPAAARVMLIAGVTASPLAAASAWNSDAAGPTIIERGVLICLAALAVTVAASHHRNRDRGASILDDAGTASLTLGLAMLADAMSVGPGDLASLAALCWVVMTGVLVAARIQRRDAELAEDRRRLMLVHLGLLGETHAMLDQTRTMQQTLGHNSSSALLAIEGAVVALGAALGEQAGVDHRSLATSTAVLDEVQRLRRMLAEEQTGSADHGGGPGAHDAPEAPRTAAETSGSGRPSAIVAVLAAIDPVIAVARAGGLSVEVDGSGDLTTTAPSDVVSEILSNLLDNAARHAPGASVRICCAHGPGGLELTVADDGPGVDPSVRPRLFQRGASIGNDRGGGLGLFSARQLAGLVGGSLELGVPASGSGSVFVLGLPTTDLLGSAVMAPPTPRREGAGSMSLGTFADRLGGAGS